MDAEADTQIESIDSVALHRAERAVLSQLDDADRAAATLQVWVAKEAVLKLTGAGLRTDPESFVVLHADGWYVEPGVLAEERIHVERLLADGYVIMLAGYRSPRRLVVRRCEHAANLE